MDPLSVLLVLVRWVRTSSFIDVFSIANRLGGIGIFYGKSNDEESLKTLTYAADRGVTFWDTADMYGTSAFITPILYWQVDLMRLL